MTFFGNFLAGLGGAGGGFASAIGDIQDQRREQERITNADRARQEALAFDKAEAARKHANWQKDFEQEERQNEARLTALDRQNELAQLRIDREAERDRLTAEYRANQLRATTDQNAWTRERADEATARALEDHFTIEDEADAMAIASNFQIFDEQGRPTGLFDRNGARVAAANLGKGEGVLRAIDSHYANLETAMRAQASMIPRDQGVGPQVPRQPYNRPYQAANPVTFPVGMLQGAPPPAGPDSASDQFRGAAAPAVNQSLPSTANMSPALQQQPRPADSAQAGPGYGSLLGYQYRPNMGQMDSTRHGGPTMPGQSAGGAAAAPGYNPGQFMGMNPDTMNAAAPSLEDEYRRRMRALQAQAGGTTGPPVPWGR